MPQKEPLSPPLLAMAGVLAAVPAAWLALAADAVVAGTASSLAGFRWLGLSVGPSFTLRADFAPDGSHAAALWAFALLAGPVATALIALVVQMLVESARSPAWLRVLALELLAFAWLRVPALMAAGAAHGRGPVAELYTQLGEPEAGRWPLGLLAVLALAAAAAVVASRTVEVGRTWMRVDGRQFRRRVARVLGGYPVLAALAGWSLVMPWAGPGWMVAWLLLTLSALSVLVS
ncbi:MAG: hypothetical protein ABSG61_07020 [Gemmatimonadales bacterium]